jgi:hypothetical protein
MHCVIATSLVSASPHSREEVVETLGLDDGPKRSIQFSEL